MCEYNKKVKPKVDPSPPMNLRLKQINCVNILIPYVLKVQPNINLSPAHRALIIIVMYSEDTNYELPHHVIFCSTTGNFLQYLLTSSLLGPHNLLSTLFSNTLSMYTFCPQCERPS